MCECRQDAGTLRQVCRCESFSCGKMSTRPLPQWANKWLTETSSFIFFPTPALSLYLTWFILLSLLICLKLVRNESPSTVHQVQWVQYIITRFPEFLCSPKLNQGTCISPLFQKILSSLSKTCSLSCVFAKANFCFLPSLVVRGCVQPLHLPQYRIRCKDKMQATGL